MKKSRSFRNFLKNFALVVLTINMLLLLVTDWSLILQRAGMTPAFWKILQGSWDGGYTQRAGDEPAAYPIRAGMTQEDGTLIGIRYHTANMSHFYETTAPLLRQALQNVPVFVLTESVELRQALQQDTLLLQYGTELPLQILGSWLESSNIPDSPQTASMFLLTKEGQLFLRSAGQLYRAQTTVDTALWNEIRASVIGVPMQYAGNTAAYTGLYPETLMLSEPQKCDILQTNLPDFGSHDAASSLQILLEAFDYSAYAKYDTEDAGATQVFVENYSTLRVSADGQVRFRATAMTGGLSAYQDGEDMSVNTTAAQIDFAQNVLGRAMRAVGTSSDTTLHAVQTLQDGTNIITFEQCVGGIPVQMTEGRSLARFAFQQGVLISADLWLRSYETTGETLYILPEKQTAATITDGREYEYAVVYTDDDSGRVLASASLQAAEEV